jgi:hypothetical protein
MFEDFEPMLGDGFLRSSYEKPASQSTWVGVWPRVGTWLNDNGKPICIANYEEFDARHTPGYTGKILCATSMDQYNREPLIIEPQLLMQMKPWEGPLPWESVDAKVEK